MAELLRRHKFTVTRTGGSSYGRSVAAFTLDDGRSLKDILVAEGLAKPVRKLRGWCDL